MKNLILCIAMCMSLTVISCKTTIPDIDTITPTVYVSVSGDGIQLGDIELNDSDFDTKALYLKRGEEYSMLFSGKDAGGVAEVIWEFPNNDIINIQSEPFPPSGWTNDVITSTTSRAIKKTGLRSDPRKAILFAGSFIPDTVDSGRPETYNFIFSVTDFNGNSATDKTLLVVIGSGPTRVGDR